MLPADKAQRPDPNVAHLCSVPELLSAARERGSDRLPEPARARRVACRRPLMVGRDRVDLHVGVEHLGIRNTNSVD